jgi:ActR/RegA family two-component response regulator
MMPRPKITVLCNELAAVRAITDALGRGFELSLAGDAQTLLASLERESSSAAVMVDMSVIQVDAIKLLEKVRGICSQSRRILLTDFCDLNIIVQGLHTGSIERIVYKPIYGPELLSAIGVNPATAPIVSTHTTQHSRVAG